MDNMDNVTPPQSPRVMVVEPPELRRKTRDSERGIFYQEDKVMIHDITEVIDGIGPELNGLIGTVSSEMKNDNKYTVTLEDGRTFSIPYYNLVEKIEPVTITPFVL